MASVGRCQCHIVICAVLAFMRVTVQRLCDMSTSAVVAAAVGKQPAGLIVLKGNDSRIIGSDLAMRYTGPICYIRNPMCSRLHGG